MAISKAKKAEIVRELREKVASAPALVFANFHGLPVAETVKLRRDLRDCGIGFKVAKKTLLRLAFSGAKIEGEMPALAGEVGVAYLSRPEAGEEEAITVPREVEHFAKAHPERLKILGGVFLGKYAGADLMLALASIPPREALLGQLVVLLNSPLRRLALVLNAISKNK